MGKAYRRFQTIYGLYKGVPHPPGGGGGEAQPTSTFFLVCTRLSDSRNVAGTRSTETRTLVQVEQATILRRDCHAQDRVLSTTYITNLPNYTHTARLVFFP